MGPTKLISLIQRDQALMLSYTFLMDNQVATLTALMLFAMPEGWPTFGKMEGVLVQLQRVPIELRCLL